jgi:hypothetical protein
MVTVFGAELLEFIVSIVCQENKNCVEGGAKTYPVDPVCFTEIAYKLPTAIN